MGVFWFRFCISRYEAQVMVGQQAHLKSRPKINAETNVLPFVRKSVAPASELLAA